MVPISDTERRRAFSIWLRTGRLSSVATADGVELKFNPWHDPEDGRFTFAGSGQSYGQSASGGFRGEGGGSGGGGGASPHEAWLRGSGSASNQRRLRPTPTTTPKAKASPARVSTSARRPNSQNGWGGGGFTGGGGGSFGGAGASGDRGVGSESQRTVSTASAIAARNRSSFLQTTTSQHSVAATPLRREVRNGYEYQIDDTGRTSEFLADLP